jgi:hypothetical protein
VWKLKTKKSMKAFFAILLLALAAANSGGKIKSLPGYSGPALSM